MYFVHGRLGAFTLNFKQPGAAILFKYRLHIYAVAIGLDGRAVTEKAILQAKQACGEIMYFTGRVIVILLPSQFLHTSMHRELGFREPPPTSSHDPRTAAAGQRVRHNGTMAQAHRRHSHTRRPVGLGHIRSA